jgi:hypothetical protein
MTQDPVHEDDLPPIVVERRAPSRKRVLFGGKVVYGNGAFVTACTIRDMSASGARIALPEGQLAPKHFYLIDVRNRTIHDCVLAWSRPPQFGVHFLHDYNIDQLTKADLHFLKRLV